MSSLASCIKRAGKALNKADADAIRDIRDELVSGGMASTEANAKAVDEHLVTLAGERTEFILQIQEAGGRTEKEEITSSKLAQQDMFGADLATQRLSDETAKRDAKRNTGQEEIETGEETDLFSQSRDQRPLKFAIDDDFTKRLVDKHPTNPIAQMSKLGAITEYLNERDIGATRKFLSTLSAAKLKTYLFGLPQSKLPDVIRNEMQGVPDYVDTIKEMDAFIDRYLEELAETGNTWRDMIRKNSTDAKLMGELMHQSSLSQTDPSKPFVMPKTFSTMKQKQKRI